MDKPRVLKILVVDDEEIVRHTIKMFLEYLGHNLHCEEDGLRGIRALENSKYDAAIVDVRMPGLDGIGFLSRAGETRPGMPVIVVSGHASPETMEEALQAGAFAFLPKPFRLDELDGLLKRICFLQES